MDVSSCCKERRGGIAGYGWNLLTAMGRVAPEHEFVLGVRSHRWTARKLIDGLLPDAPRKLLFDPLAGLTFGGVDVFHSIGVRLPRTRAFPKVITLYDLNVFEFPELAKPAWREKRQARIRQTVPRADRILTLAQQGADAAHEILGVEHERLRPVLLAVDTDQFKRPGDELIAAAAERHGLGERPYVLTLGPFGRRKNQLGLLTAFARAELPSDWLLVIGGTKEEHADTVRAEALAAGLDPARVVLPGWIPDEDLVPLLSGASIYACSSMHEGFGLPVIEAQACGVPVVSSNRGALAETLGNCGLLFDPTDVDDFANALHRLAVDDILRARFASDGPRRVAEHFTWDRVARETLAVYAELAGDTGR